MREVQDILFSVTGQTLHHDCAEGRPSSVTSVEIFPWTSSDDADSEWVATGSVETNPDTTIDADSGYGQTDARKLNVAATTGFEVGRTYLATTADGARDWFECAEIDSGNYILARHPVHNAYVSGDDVESTRITASVDSTWVADDANLLDAGPNPAYRVRWVYIVDNATYVVDTYFNLVRYAGKHGVRPMDIESMLPGWLDMLPTDHRNDQGRRLIDEAYRAVKFDLHQVWTADEQVSNSEVVDELTRYKTLELTALGNAMRMGDDGRYTVSKAAYQSRLDQLARITPKIPVRDTTAAATTKVSLGLSRR